MTTKKCSKCFVEKSKDQFYSRKGRKDSYSYCKDCFNQYCMDRWKERKIKIVDEMGGCCSRCGYNKSLSALEFHHKDKTTKEYEWSKMRMLSEEKLNKELAKCILVCANCHREIHDETLVQNTVI
jgi:hypothetical protein